jgi:hypothetical protein
MRRLPVFSGAPATGFPGSAPSTNCRRFDEHWQEETTSLFDSGVCDRVSGDHGKSDCALEHDPEKWIPVFRKDHAPPKISSVIRSIGMCPK